MGEVFIGSEAISAGRVSRHELQRWYRPLYRGVYVPKHSVQSIRDRAMGAWLASDRRGAIGAAASALHGAQWVDDDIPIELISSRARRQRGLVVHDEALGDNIDVAGVEAHGGIVVNAPGSNSDAVADLTLGLMIVTTRRVLEASASLMRGEWSTFTGREIRGLVLGIIGFGRIGRAVATRAHAFGARIIAYDPFLPDTAFTDAGVDRVGLAGLLAGSDVVTLHMPGEKDKPLLDRAALATMRHGAVLINAARGGLVDENGVAAMLHDGRLSAAAFDAFQEEPPSDSPLLQAPNVVLTPHIGAYTDGANAAMGVAVVDDIARVLAGEEPHNRVTV